MHLQQNIGRIFSGMIVVASLALITPTLSGVGNVDSVFGYGAGLSVDNTTVLNGYAVADNSYDNGFKFRMRVTIDSALENGLALKFADWARDGGGGSIATSGNMLVNLSNTTAGAAAAANAYGSDMAVGSDVDPVAL